MKVYTIDHDDNGRGYTVHDTAFFTEEFVEELKEYPEECEYTESEILPFAEKIKTLEIGEQAEMGVWKITCSDMSQETYDNLPEFEGW